MGPHSGSEPAADSSPSTRRAYDVPMAVVEDESEPVTESELEDEGKFMLTSAGIPGCLLSRCMVLSGGTPTKKRSQWQTGPVAFSCLWSWQALALVFLSQSTVVFGRISVITW